jgi:23S rRNA (cytosine1962-C5)-methyltransferase
MDARRAGARHSRRQGDAPALVLKSGREKSLARRHPWVFSGAVERVEGAPGPGATVAVRAAAGEFLAWAAYSPQSQIRARVWSFDESDAIDAEFFRARIAAAVSRRAGLERDADALRLVHGEADGLPGVICDRYAGIVVMQLSSAGADRWRDEIVEAACDATGCREAYERSDLEVRALEGLPARVGALRGAPDAVVTIAEHGLRFRVDVAHGQKTGFYLDQRANRRRVGALAEGRDVLNAFCYSGGFSLSALAGGAASMLSIDSSAAALELGRENLALNGLDAARAEWRDADVFQCLRALRNAGRAFDLVVLDPPKFAPTAAHAARAARAYKDVNLLALKLLRPGGLLATFSCSGGVSADLFQKIVAGAAADAGADAEIVERFHADRDHPVLLSFPEGEYLKGLLLRKR